VQLLVPVDFCALFLFNVDLLNVSLQLCQDNFHWLSRLIMVCDVPLNRISSQKSSQSTLYGACLLVMKSVYCCAAFLLLLKYCLAARSSSSTSALIRKQSFVQFLSWNFRGEILLFSFISLA
jgi:hypothetical protein